MADFADKKQRFIDKLLQMFQLDQPELDFGLYRIMHAKSAQIKAFIENDLTVEIDQAFSASGEGKVAELKAKYEQAHAQAVEFGIADPDSNPKVMEAKAAYDAARDGGGDPGEIYDHLYRFFSRYYDKGDFMSRRYHVAENDSRAAPYAVPYDGREVYLHWANKDQYYVKSSETLTNFSFDLAEALRQEQERQRKAGQAALDLDGVPARPLKVHFRIKSAAEGAHNNVKENQTRFFIVHGEEPVRLDGDELTIHFEYRPDPNKEGRDDTWQRRLLEEAEAVVFAALRGQVEARSFLDGLSRLAPTDKRPERSLLLRYLERYTARNTMDYFIHKNLGGFLRRELDFYIKNEIIRLDDVEGADASAVGQWLDKVKVLRRIARQVIDFLAQLENFQKKLWLKKKFVVETQYCITLDRVPEEFYPEIAANDAQREEWIRLYAIDESEDTAYSIPLTVDFLRANPALVIDTALYPADFKERLLSRIEGLDEQCGGLLVHSENFQALRLMQPKLQERVRCLYIDPPYNTGSDGFLYKDAYRHASWLAMMADRLRLGRAIASRDAALFVSIDDNEQASLRHIVDDSWGGENFIATVIWQKLFSPKNSARHFSEDHDFLLVCARDAGLWAPQLLPRTAEMDARYSNPDNDPRGPWTSGDLSARNPYSEGRYSIKCPSGRVIPGPPPGRYWAISKKKFEELDRDNRIWWGDDGDAMPRFKRFLSDVKQGRVPQTIWPYSEVGHTQDAKRELLACVALDPDQSAFQTPKPTALIRRVLALATTAEEPQWVVDFFAGSGTTGHAVIQQNREDKGQRCYALVEIGDYFDQLLLPRIKKAIYANEWAAGKPTNRREGASHCLKYLRLESYEDTLNNLSLRQDAVEVQHSLARDYLLRYWLAVETRGSRSLLDVKEFRSPASYRLKIKRPGSEELSEVNVDLVETFNWLIGLDVTLFDRPRTYTAEFARERDPELPEDQSTRLQCIRLKETDDGPFWFRIVEGSARRTPGNEVDKDKVLVVWRKLTDDPEQDAAVLEALLEKYRISAADSEYDTIYINGSHGLALTGEAKARVLSLEETFMARMWEGADDEDLH